MSRCVLDNEETGKRNGKNRGVLFANLITDQQNNSGRIYSIDGDVFVGEEL